ncbi:MAG: ABC transporter ATP-binding protein [Thermodesulfobacteriota bacterium]|nr:ABC transporter ATP-binding protein [Thermodesulfobacteriota bacterium]
MLNIRKIDAGYDTVKILDSVSLELLEGETRSVIGANNSGKTTLFKAITGLIRPFSGEITFDGVNLIGLTTAQIVEMGIVLIPERRRLFSRMSVHENLLLGSYAARGRKERRKNLAFVYDLFPVLKNRSKQLAGILSGGEQQMLAIARGIMAKPRLLLLDEPSLGLSPMIIQDIFGIFASLNEQGVFILLAEQNAEVALRASSRTYVLSNGRVALRGESRALLQDKRVENIYLGKTGEDE